MGAILDDPARAARMRAELLALRDSLGEPGAAERAARIIIEEVSLVGRATEM
jgi:hypothetical protein